MSGQARHGDAVPIAVNMDYPALRPRVIHQFRTAGDRSEKYLPRIPIIERGTNTGNAAPAVERSFRTHGCYIQWASRRSPDGMNMVWLASR